MCYELGIECRFIKVQRSYLIDFITKKTFISTYSVVLKPMNEFGSMT